MLTMTGLTKSYRTDTVETLALDAIDLDIADGEFVAIMGPSGCGKSTLLNMLGMLDSPTSGSYVFNGVPLLGAPNIAGWQTTAVKAPQRTLLVMEWVEGD